MKKLLLLLACICAIYSCSTTKTLSGNAANQTNSTTSVEGNDGLSIEKAIVLNEKNETQGVSAEYTWLRNNYPGYKLKRQSLIDHNNKYYDKMEIITAEGGKLTIYFDITNFFGKM